MGGLDAAHGAGDAAHGAAAAQGEHDILVRADCMVDIAVPPKPNGMATVGKYIPGLRAFEVCASCNRCVDKQVQAPAQTPEPTAPEPTAPSFALATLVRTLESTIANPNPSLAAAIPDFKSSGVSVAGSIFRGAEIVFTLTQQGGVADAESLLMGALEPEAMRSLIGDSLKVTSKDVTDLLVPATFDVTVQTIFPPRPPPTPPPTPPSPPPPSPPPPPPSPPPSTEVVVIRMTASGDVSDYTPNVTASLKANLAAAADLDASLVTITVEPGSVLITATIAVPAAMQSYALRNLIQTKLGTPEAATAALGITVFSAPTFVIASTTPVAGLSDSEAMQNEKPSDKLPAGWIVGLCIGVVLVGLCAMLAGRYYLKYKKAKKTLAQSVQIDASTKDLPVQPTDAPPAGKADRSESWMADARAAGWGPPTDKSAYV